MIRLKHELPAGPVSRPALSSQHGILVSAQNVCLNCAALPLLQFHLLGFTTKMFDDPSSGNARARYSMQYAKRIIAVTEYDNK